jgi:hypothetical protein
MLTPTGWRGKNLEEYDAFKHLVGDLFLRGSDLMAILTVYGDASGSAPDRPIIVIGGFVSTVEQWASFNEHWGRVLASGPVEVYHSTDLEGFPPRGEFQGWKAKRIEKFRTLAYKTLREYVAVGVSTALVKADYEALKIRWHKIRQGKPANHYYFCVNDFVAMVSQWAIAHGYTSNPINYVLERGDPGKGEVQQMFLELSQDPAYEYRHLIGTVSFLPKRCPTDPERHKRLRPLQAADIWAYEGYRMMNDRVVPIEAGLPPRNARPALDLLFKDAWRPYNAYWNMENLKKFAEQLKTIEMAS